MALTKAAITRVRSLRDKKHREELGLFAVEGVKVVAELLAANFPFVEIYATEAWPAPATASVTPTLVTEDEMARLSHFPTSSPVLAIGRITRPQLARDELNLGLTLALDGIQDPGNVGTLLRIADWYGLARVVLSPDCADLFSAKVIHASMGSFARVKAHVTPLAETLAACRVPVLGCDLQGANVHTLAAIPNAIVVIGSEGRGLSPAVAAQVTQRVTISRFGGAESLNAAVAAAVVCDNLRRIGG